MPTRLLHVLDSFPYYLVQLARPGSSIYGILRSDAGGAKPLGTRADTRSVSDTKAV